MNLQILSFSIGTALGSAGLVVAYIQWRRTKNVEKLRREQLLMAINRAKHLIMPINIIERVLLDDSIESKETLREWLWALYKGASDSYVSVVHNYLSFEGSFTFDDIKCAKKSGIITTNWEEHIWLSLVALRPENRKPGTNLPEFNLDQREWIVHFPRKEVDEIENQDAPKDKD
jgi:hypothetical protein